MKNEKLETIACVVRVWVSTGEYIILFPDDYDARRGYVGSWMWVGQHGGADPGITDRKYTRPATQSEIGRAVRDYERCYSGINGEFFKLRPLKRLRRPAVRHG